MGFNIIQLFLLQLNLDAVRRRTTLSGQQILLARNAGAVHMESLQL
jgi:hypothetical protein